MNLITCSETDQSQVRIVEKMILMSCIGYIHDSLIK